MRPVLRPGSPLLRRDAEHLQLGTEPGHALVVAAHDAVADLLCGLDGVRTLDDPTLDAPLVDALLAAGVVVDSDVWRTESGLESEAAHLLTRGVDGAVARAQLARRRSATVRIIGESSLGAAVADLLTDSGVGSVASATAPTSGLDLVILAGEGETAREIGDECLRVDVPHLVTATRDGCGVVGPLVRPGRTACLRCIDAARSSVDAAWPAIVAQLERPLAAASDSLVRAVSAVLDAAVAVLTVRDALAHLAAEPTLTGGATIRVGPDLADLRRHHWPLQPGCGCAPLT
jgi:hypothetical protein